MNTLTHYQQQLPAGADASRQKAMQAFLGVGLPTRKDEAWKYTRAKFLQEKNYSVDHSAAFEFGIPPNVGVDVVFVNSGAHVQGNGENALLLLNHALYTEVCEIKIPEETRVEEVLKIRVKKPAKDQARFLKLNIHLEKNAAAEIILSYDDAAKEFINLAIETRLAEKAQLKFIHICQNKAENYIHHSVYQAKASELKALNLNLKSAWFRQDLTVHLQEEYATCSLRGIYLGKEKEHIDHHLCVKHKAPHGKSEQIFKGVLSEQARAVFNGKVVVEKGAKKTDARQKNDSILLSTEAEIDTKPELEIYNDDVSCAHGATVGELSSEALFYLVSRGIEEGEAKKILLNAFVKDIVGEDSGTLALLAEERLSEF